MNKFGNILWGLVLIALGVIFGLNALDITDVNIFFDGWWTLFIIVPCFIGLFKNHSKIGDIIGLFIGVSLLLGAQDLVDIDIIWKLLFPFIIIMIGLNIIFKDSFGGKIKNEIKKIENGERIEYCATFSSVNADLTKEKFEGCNIDSIFGSVKLDLTNATIKDDVLIKTTCVFGGATIILPDNVNVKIKSVPIFGGVSNSNRNKNKDGQKTIYIDATSMFGGVEVK